MKHRFTHENGTSFCLQPLRREEIIEAQRLCDQCVGKNLYSQEEIASAIDARDRFFYLLKSETDETVGYIYYYLTDKAHISNHTRLDAELFHAVYDKGERVGKIQSVGLKPEYRGIGLAAQMIRFALDELKAVFTDVVFIVCWKPGGVMPLGKALKECRFDYLTEAKLVWHNETDLVCPYCEGRCMCDAEVYYQLLDGEMKDEAETFA